MVLRYLRKVSSEASVCAGGRGVTVCSSGRGLLKLKLGLCFPSCCARWRRRTALLAQGNFEASVFLCVRGRGVCVCSSGRRLFKLKLGLCLQRVRNGGGSGGRRLAMPAFGLGSGNSSA